MTVIVLWDESRVDYDVITFWSAGTTELKERPFAERFAYNW